MKVIDKPSVAIMLGRQVSYLVPIFHQRWSFCRVSTVIYHYKPIEGSRPLVNAVLCFLCVGVIEMLVPLLVSLKLN